MEFEDEKSARVEFEDNNECVYAKQSALEKRFITLKNTIPDLISDSNEFNTKVFEEKCLSILKDINQLYLLFRHRSYLHF